MPPRVSIVLPNLNHRRFLEERLRSIDDQTLTEWELIIVDSFSNDGAWELLKSYADQESRATAFQAPRGLYESWNRALECVRGQYVYIATSDDSMREDALEIMASVLDEHPQCGICDSRLQMIDSQGVAVDSDASLQPCQRFMGTILDRQHIRRMPYDALLHTCGRTVYTSMTQILFRQELLALVGPFSTKWGTRCDYEWGFRAALMTDTVYTPEKIGYWRRHDNQATGSQKDPMHLANYEMLLSAFAFLQTQNRQHPLNQETQFLSEFLKARSFRDLIRNGALLHRLRSLVSLCTHHPIELWNVLFEQMHSNAGDSIQAWLQMLNERFDMPKLVEVL
ncbi:MAG: glycosyltransferase [bacterium]|nr:glycosyltransferase [bacterium]